MRLKDWMNFINNRNNYNNNSAFFVRPCFARNNIINDITNKQFQYSFKEPSIQNKKYALFSQLLGTAKECLNMIKSKEYKTSEILDKLSLYWELLIIVCDLFFINMSTINNAMERKNKIRGAFNELYYLKTIEVEESDKLLLKYKKEQQEKIENNNKVIIHLEKLVRDLVIDKLAQDGYNPKYEKISSNLIYSIKIKLFKKLTEESDELMRTQNIKQMIEELVDCFQIFDTILRHHNISYSHLFENINNISKEFGWINDNMLVMSCAPINANQEVVNTNIDKRGINAL